MPNPKVLVTLFIALAVALAAAQTLPITANVQLYGAPPYSPKAPGTTFNLYEWVVINGTVTSQADFGGNVTVTVFDTTIQQTVANCTVNNIGLSKGVTYSLYNLLQGKCALRINPGYNFASYVEPRSDGLALNFTDKSVIGVNRYIVYVTFKSTAGSKTFNATFSISNSIDMAVKAFGVKTITWGTKYPHNVNYDFRMVVYVMHPDGRDYYNTSITMYFGSDPNPKIARYWANNTGSNQGVQYGNSINNASWVLTISSNDLSTQGSYSIMVNVSNVRLSVNSQYQRVGYNVTGVNKGQLNFTLYVNNQLTVKFINVTAVWPKYDSTPPSFVNKPTGVSYTNVTSFNASKWTLGDAFLLYAQLLLANGTTVPSSAYSMNPAPSSVPYKLTASGNYVVFAVTATLKESDWRTYYRSAYSGVMVNATLTLKDSKGNTGTLPLRFIVTNTTESFTWTIFYNASKAPITNGSRVNLGDVIALNLTVVTYGGRTLYFTKGFDITVYNVTRSGLKDYTSRFSVRPKNGTIYLVVDPSRNAWGISKTNWRSFMNATYLAVNVAERGMPGYMSLTLWWPDYLGGGRYKNFNINVTAMLPNVTISFRINRTTVDYGQGVMLTITFRTYGGNATVAKNLTLYVYKIDTQTRPFGWSNVTALIISRTTYRPYPSAGNYTFAFNVNGKYPWIPGVWYINATVGDIFGNAGDLNKTKLFAIRPNITHSLPASLRVMAGGVIQLSSPVSWGNGTAIQGSAHMNVTITYPTPSGTSNTTLPLGTIAYYLAVPPFQAPNTPGTYSIVVSFTYMTFGKTLKYVWTINLTVYIAINATFSSMRSNPSQVAVVVGESTPRGPVQGALVEDDLAAAILAGLIGTSNVYFDSQLLNPTTLAYTSTASSYRYIIAIGGPLVNLFSYKYNSTLSSIVETYKRVVGGDTVEVGFKVMGNSNISRVYLNLTNNKYYIVYANGTVKAAGSYGNTDFAIIATVYDPSVGKYIFISYGLDWRGTVAAGQWLAANVNNLSQLAYRQLVLLQWINGVGTVPILQLPQS